MGMLIAMAVSGNAQKQDQDAGSANRAARTAETTTTVPYHPLTGGQRWREYLKSSFGPQAFLRSAASAAIGQWKDRPEEWGQGGLGFGRRFASSFGQHMTQTTLEFPLAAALGEDNRYIPSGQSGFKARTLYAAESVVLARRRDGTRRLSVSHLSAVTAAAFISRAWQPRSTSSARSAGVSIAIALCAGAGVDAVREFWLHKK